MLNIPNFGANLEKVDVQVKEKFINHQAKKKNGIDKIQPLSPLDIFTVLGNKGKRNTHNKKNNDADLLATASDADFFLSNMMRDVNSYNNLQTLVNTDEQHIENDLHLINNIKVDRFFDDKIFIHLFLNIGDFVFADKKNTTTYLQNVYSKISKKKKILKIPVVFTMFFNPIDQVFEMAQQKAIYWFDNDFLNLSN